MEITVHTDDSTAAYKAQLNELIFNTFGFTFERFQQQGLWNTDYVCYSMINNGTMLANVSVYRMDMLINGVEKQVRQIGTVATHKENRGQGLSRKIFEFIFEQYPDEVFFLCANETVLDFYPKFGFVPLLESQPYIQDARLLPSGQEKLNRSISGGVRKLSLDDPAVDCYLKERTCFSNILDCANAAPVNWFHLDLEFSNHIYEIPTLQVLLVAEQEGGTLTIADIIAKQPVRFEQIVPFLPFVDVDTIRFGFNPDWLSVNYEMRDPAPLTNLFVRGELGISGRFILPVMVQT